MKLFLEAGANPNRIPLILKTPLSIAINNDAPIEIFEALIQADVDVNDTFCADIREMRPIELAVENKNFALFKLLLRCPKINLDFVIPNFGRSFIHQLTYLNAPEFSFKVFESGKLNLNSKVNQAAVYEAFSTANFSLTSALINGFGTDNFNFNCCSWNSRSQHMYSLLHESILMGRRQFVYFLCKFTQASYEVADKNAVMLAFQTGDCEIIKALFAAQPDKFISALVAAANGPENVIKFLVQRRNGPIFSTMLECLETGEHATTLLSHNYELEVAFEAARLNCVSIVDLMLKRGVDPKYRNQETFSLLEIAATFDYSKLAKFLLETCKIDVNESVPVSRRTALHVAAKHDSVEVAALLLRASANFENSFLYEINAEEPRFRSLRAIDVAERSCSSRVVLLLREAFNHKWALKTGEIFNEGL